MTTTAQQRNIGAFIKAVQGVVPYDVTAAATATNDALDKKGPGFDRHTYLSCKGIVTIDSTINTAETNTVTARLQHNDVVTANDGGWADFGAIESLVIVDGSDETGLIAFDRDLSDAKQWVRLVVKADMSRSGTDTCRVAGVLVFGGGSEVPPA